MSGFSTTTSSSSLAGTVAFSFEVSSSNSGENSIAWSENILILYVAVIDVTQRVSE